MTITQRAIGARSVHASTDVDRAIVADLQERRGSELFGFARHLGLSPDEANDAAQEALLRLWVEIDAGKAIGQPDAWAFRTLYRICMDQHRWRRRLQGLAERLGSPPTLAASDPTDTIAVWSAVERLPERQRLAVYLRFRADLPFEEIGAILGTEAVTARSQVSRALDTLRAALSEPEVTR